ncbi:MAG: PAS domain S-box protein, partial [Desulfobacteraceae bacterium]|nr:PAS domain S-box protein [Desulfobacteraceae bacterium]
MSKNDSSEKELIKKIDGLNSIIDEAPIPMLVINNDHKIIHYNKAIEELTGFPREEMIGTDNQWKAFYAEKHPIMADFIVDKTPEEEIVKYYGSKFRQSEMKNERYTAEDFFSDLGEKGKWLYFTVAPIKDDNNEIIGAVETLQDITDKKNAEKIMANSRRHYRMLLEFVPYPIIVHDKNALVSYLNPAFTETFGWTYEELKGSTIPFVPRELNKETKDVIKKFFEERSLTRYETQRYTKDGVLLDVIIWATSFSSHDKDSKENFVVLRNITKEKR